MCTCIWLDSLGNFEPFSIDVSRWIVQIHLTYAVSIDCSLAYKKSVLPSLFIYTHTMHTLT